MLTLKVSLYMLVSPLIQLFAIFLAFRMHCEVTWVLMVPKGTPLMMLELSFIRIVLLVRFVPLIRVIIDDFLIKWRNLHEPTLVVTSFVGVKLSSIVRILISFIKMVV